MTKEQLSPLDAPIQEALQVLQRLAQLGAASGPSSARSNEEAAPPLPPRVEALPAWSAEHFRDMVDLLPDGVVVIDLSGTIVLVNRQTERMFGYARDELLGQAIELLVPERLRNMHVGQRNGYLAAPQTRALGDRTTELFGRRKDGSEFPVEISLSPMRGPSGLLVSSVIRDQSERKRHAAKFRTLIENIPAVTFIAPLDRSAPELYVSPQIEELLGFSQKEWLENPVLWFRQLHPDDRERWNLQFAPTCSDGVPFNSIYRFIAKNGRVVWVHGSATIVRDERNQPLFLQGVAFDVTSIKEAEEERDRFFSLSLDLLCVAGMDGHFKRVNQAFTAVLGHDEAELMRRPFLDFVHPDDREATLGVMASLARGEPTERFENRYVCRDGSYRWLQWVAVPAPHRDYCYAAARDVTREKEDEEQLREQARLSSLRADISAAITGSDTLGNMLGRCASALLEDLDAALARIWTFNEAEGVLELAASAGMDTRRGGPHARVKLGGDKIGLVAERLTPLWTNAVIGDERIKDQEWARREGLVSFAGYPLLIEGRLVGVLALYSRHALSPGTLQALDLIAAQVSLGVKRKQAEEALRRVNTELERRVEERTEELRRSLAESRRKSEELRQYSGQALHDIQKPLTAINIHTQRMSRDYAGQLPGDAGVRLQKVLDLQPGIKALLDQLRKTATVAVDEPFAEVDCNAVVSSAKALLGSMIEGCDGHVDVVDKLPRVMGVREHLEWLLQNLIENALKYRSPERAPRIEVSAGPHADGWLFQVKDNGEGIDPKYWHKIFKMGKESRVNTKVDGWGYGLAICEKTVVRHGGRIWVGSEPGQGSTFYFTLPAAPRGS
jgi:PAS domain S-box-containing protein